MVKNQLTASLGSFLPGELSELWHGPQLRSKKMSPIYFTMRYQWLAMRFFIDKNSN
jgi:hypothetical protein